MDVQIKAGKYRLTRHTLRKNQTAREASPGILRDSAEKEAPGTTWRCTVEEEDEEAGVAEKTWREKASMASESTIFRRSPEVQRKEQNE